MKLRMIIAGLLVGLCITLTACNKNAGTSGQITSLDEIDGRNMGCMSGSIFDMVIKEKFPNSPITYFISRRS